MKKDIERAVEMLRIAAQYLHENEAVFDLSATIYYDRTENDGGSVQMDCEHAATCLEGKWKQVKEALGL